MNNPQREARKRRILVLKARIQKNVLMIRFLLGVILVLDVTALSALSSCYHSESKNVNPLDDVTVIKLSFTVSHLILGFKTFHLTSDRLDSFLSWCHCYLPLSAVFFIFEGISWIILFQVTQKPFFFNGLYYLIITIIVALTIHRIKKIANDTKEPLVLVEREISADPDWNSYGAVRLEAVEVDTSSIGTAESWV